MNHPFIPVSFDAPSTIKTRGGFLYWGKGVIDQKNGISEKYVTYGIRTVYRNPDVPAIEIQFAWLDDRHAIARSITLERLYREIAEHSRAREFYLLNFYAPDIRDDAEKTYRDVGSITIDGRIGRHIQDVPSRDPYRPPTEIYIVPLDLQNTLVIKVKFCEPTEEERNIIAPQIINSIKVDFPKVN